MFREYLVTETGGMADLLPAILNKSGYGNQVFMMMTISTSMMMVPQTRSEGA